MHNIYNYQGVLFQTVEKALAKDKRTRRNCKRLTQPLMPWFLSQRHVTKKPLNLAQRRKNRYTFFTYYSPFFYHVFAVFYLLFTFFYHVFAGFYLLFTFFTMFSQFFTYYSPFFTKFSLFLPIIHRFLPLSACKKENEMRLTKKKKHPQKRRRGKHPQQL